MKIYEGYQVVGKEKICAVGCLKVLGKNKKNCVVGCLKVSGMEKHT